MVLATSVLFSILISGRTNCCRKETTIRSRQGIFYKSLILIVLND
jgi:hypothetical protein